MVEASEQHTACAVEETIGDSAYGDGQTRQAFHDAGRVLIAKVPPVTNRGFFPKTDFQIDLGTMTCTCPAQQTTDDFHPARAGGGAFHFATVVCAACPQRAQCVPADAVDGRSRCIPRRLYS